MRFVDMAIDLPDCAVRHPLDRRLDPVFPKIALNVEK